MAILEKIGTDPKSLYRFLVTAEGNDPGMCLPEIRYCNKKYLVGVVLSTIPTVNNGDLLPYEPQALNELSMEFLEIELKK